MCFELGVPRNELAQTTTKMYVTGFGGEPNDDYEKKHINDELISTSERGIMSTGEGILSSTTGFDNYRARYSCDTIGGDSGAPVYIINNNIKTVIAINTSGAPNHTSYNTGLRITTDILNFVYDNPNLN